MDEINLYDLNNRLLDDCAFSSAALDKLHRIQSRLPECLHSTYTVASSAAALVNHWLVERKLDCYVRGRKVDDVTAISLSAPDQDFGRAADISDAFTTIRCEELSVLMKKEGLPIPSFLTDVGDPAAGIGLELAPLPSEPEAVTQESMQTVSIELGPMHQDENPQESSAATRQGQAPSAEEPSLGRLPLPANQARRNRTRERKDALSLELEDIIQVMGRDGRITAVGIMAKLKASAGTGGCVTDIDAFGDGVIWENSKGKSRTLTLEALDARLIRMRKSLR